MQDDSDWVSASEVAEIAYCARAYRLMRVDRVALTEDVQERLTGGTRHHAAHGRRYARQRALRLASIVLSAAAAVLALVAILASG